MKQPTIKELKNEDERIRKTEQVITIERDRLNEQIFLAQHKRVTIQRRIRELDLKKEGEKNER